MKKVLLLLFTLLVSCQLHAVKVNTNFGFPVYQLGDDYTQYINKRVKFYPKKFNSSNYKHLNLNVDYEDVYV